MPVRIHLHTLDDALITVGGKEVRPTSPMVFAALLFFCLERGHRVPRTALQELLFPETDERSGAHSVRQLLYKLRQLGVPLQTSDTTLALPAEHVHDDFPDAAAIAADRSLLARASTGLLPRYEPRVSPAFDRWLDEHRARATTRARSAMLDALAQRRVAGDHVAMDAIASALLRLDPLNEEATLVRAEVLALTGRKQDALRMLEHYSAEVGLTSPHLQIAPDLLRRRIAERFHAADREAVPMLGRQEELAFLLAQFARASEGMGTLSIVWGEAGIGKTRLLQEFTSHLALKNARVETARCQSFDRERPLGALVDLVPKLLQARGALGVSPESLEQLRRLSGEISTEQPRETHPELTAARIREAITDLVLCVAAERPVVLVVEDAHWLDDASLRLLLGLVPGQAARLHLVITMRDRPRFPQGVRVSESVVVRHLSPLNDSDASDLLVRTLGSGFALEDQVRGQCVALASGNPLFICTVAEHLRLRGSAPSAQSGIEDLLKQRIRILDGPSLLLLRAIAALSTHATPERLRACTGLSVEAELLALQDLADHGLIARQDGSIRCAHDVLTEVVLSDAPPVIRTAIYERVASVLEEDGTVGKQVQLLWSCAESWTHADNAARAGRVLRRCAQFAVEVGQPLFALSALQHALRSSSDDERTKILEEIIALADMTFEVDTVIRSVKQYRAATAMMRAASPPAIDLAEITALIRLGLGSESSHAELLRRIALDKRVDVKSRLRAARLFIGCAELRLDRSQAVEFYAEFSDVPQKARTLEAHEFMMLFHCAFGDMALARELGQDFVTRIGSCDAASRTRLLLSASRVLFDSGAIEDAVQLTSESVELGRKLQIHDHLMITYCRFADYYIMLGDLASAESWHSLATSLSERGVKSSVGYRLSNALELALCREHYERARQILQELTVHEEASWPHATRTIRGFVMRLPPADHGDKTQLDQAELRRIDDIGRELSNHNVFAVGLFSELTRAGHSDEAARRWKKYATSQRRERVDLRPFVRIGVKDQTLAERMLRLMED